MVSSWWMFCWIWTAHSGVLADILFPFFVVGGYDIRARLGLARRRDVRAEADGRLLWAWGIGAPCFFGFFFAAEGGRFMGELYHGEPRRTAAATAKPLSTKGHEGPRRTATATAKPLSTKGHEGPRRTATAKPLSTEDTEGHGELQLQNLYPRRTRRATENCNCKTFIHEGPRRTATATSFVHGGPRRGTAGGGGTGKVCLHWRDWIL